MRLNLSNFAEIGLEFCHNKLNVDEIFKKL